MGLRGINLELRGINSKVCGNNAELRGNNPGLRRKNLKFGGNIVQVCGINWIPDQSKVGYAELIRKYAELIPKWAEKTQLFAELIQKYTESNHYQIKSPSNNKYGKMKRTATRQTNIKKTAQYAKYHGWKVSKWRKNSPNSSKHYSKNIVSS